MRAVPHDPEAEEVVIGCCLLSAEATRWAAEWLRPADFYAPRWRVAMAAIHALHAEGAKVDALTVADRARTLGEGAPDVGTLLATHGAVPSLTTLPRYGHIVRRSAVARAAMGLCLGAADGFGDRKKDPDEVLDDLLAELRGIDAHVPAGDVDGFSTFEELRNKPKEARAPWVLRGLLRRDWRAIFVGPEGSGKTLLLRQLAVAAAAGIAPFGGVAKADPVRSLIVDLENPEDHLLDWLDRLCRHGERLAKRTEGRGAVWHRPGGIDLRRRVWRGQLEDVLRKHRPELVCLGPLYKSFRRRSSETEEEAAGELQEILDDLRTRFGFALVMEHHAPKGSAGVRELTPFGSSLWLRWGEIRMSLVPPDRDFPVWEMELRPFSGSRTEHGWPNHVDRNRQDGLAWLGRWGHDREEPI